MERDKMVEALAERLRFLCCTHVQGLDKSEIRPFEQSAGRTGWIMVAGIIADEAAMAHASTLAALQARLAAAERERDKAVGLLLCYRILDNHGLDADKHGGLPDIPFDAMRAAGLPQAGYLGDCYDIVRRAVDDFRAHLASRPEGEVRS